jgi:CelD/BcsL family acetyltransferase involved in cellulose biosynthesis
MTSLVARIGLARERAIEAPSHASSTRTGWTSLELLGELRGEWRELAMQALEPNVFYEPAFALAAAPALGARVGAVAVWAKGARRLIGLFPARVERRYGVMGTFTGWVHPFAPFGVPLIDRTEADAALTAFFDHVEAHPRLPKVLLLPMISREGRFAEALARVLAQRGGAMAPFGEHARAMLAPADRRDTYLDQIASKKLKELRRQRRRLADDAPVRLQTTWQPAATASALVDFFTLEANGWKGTAGTASVQSEAIRQFMQHAVPDLAALGQARIDRLFHGPRPIATTITLLSDTHAWLWKIAYDEAFARASPGVQLALEVTRDLLAERSITQTDSCATADHPMIDHLWTERMPLADLLIAPSSNALASWHIARRLETLRRSAAASARQMRAMLR